MKVYAKQMNPAYQESPLMLFDEWPDGDMVIDGNRHYHSRTIWEYDKIKADFDNMAEEWIEDGSYWEFDGKNMTKHSKPHTITVMEILNDYGFKRNDGKPWTTNQRHEWKLLMEGTDVRDDDDLIPKALELMTGHKWKSGTIRGCCQGDWQDVYYRVDRWNKKSLEAFETEYFNTGSEWMIHEPDFADVEEPEDPEDINGFTCYCVSWNEDGIREEIASAAGCKPEDVVMYVWDGTYSVNKYRMVV